MWTRVVGYRKLCRRDLLAAQWRVEFSKQFRREGNCENVHLEMQVVDLSEDVVVCVAHLRRCARQQHLGLYFSG